MTINQVCMCTPPGTLFLVFLTLPPPYTHILYFSFTILPLFWRSKVSPVVQSTIYRLPKSVSRRVKSLIIIKLWLIVSETLCFQGDNIFGLIVSREVKLWLNCFQRIKCLACFQKGKILRLNCFRRGKI